MTPQLFTPWTIHEADAYLYSAWQDGMPMAGPGGGRGAAWPVFSSKITLSVEQSAVMAPAGGMDWRAVGVVADTMYALTLEFPDGVQVDEDGIRAAIPAFGQYVLVVLYRDHLRGVWRKLQFFYVTADSNGTAEANQQMKRTMRFHASWLDEDEDFIVGGRPVPSALPQVKGIVEWVCGPHRIRAYSYDPDTNEWLALPQNVTGDGSSYVTIGPVAEDSADLALAYYQPRALPVEGDFGGATIPTWQNTVVMRVGGESSPWHYGLCLMSLNIQTLGIAEPLLMLPQSREWDEPVVVFRYLRRVLAVIGHGVFCVPDVHYLPFPDYPIGPAFRFMVSGGSGISIHTDGLWMDGTIETR